MRGSRFPAGGLALDAAMVVLFAAVGRVNHDQAHPVLGVLQTAWPFLVGTALGWALVAALGRRSPLDLGGGAVVLASTVGAGMLLRAALGAGTAGSFIVVTTLVLSVLLLGWRWLAARLRTRD